MRKFLSRFFGSAPIPAEPAPLPPLSAGHSAPYELTIRKRILSRDGAFTALLKAFDYENGPVILLSRNVLPFIVAKFRIYIKYRENPPLCRQMQQALVLEMDKLHALRPPLRGEAVFNTSNGINSVMPFYNPLTNKELSDDEIALFVVPTSEVARQFFDLQGDALIAHYLHEGRLLPDAPSATQKTFSLFAPEYVQAATGASPTKKRVDGIVELMLLLNDEMRMAEEGVY